LRQGFFGRLDVAYQAIGKRFDSGAAVQQSQYGRLNRIPPLRRRRGELPISGEPKRRREQISSYEPDMECVMLAQVRDGANLEKGPPAFEKALEGAPFAKA